MQLSSTLKYFTVTNNMGVAKVIIKKPVLNGLVVGKRVTYQAIFLKNVVKKTAIVR